MRRSATILISVASGFALLAAGTTAGAAIAGGPIDGSGVIYGCFTTKAVNGSHALVLQDVGTTCPSGTTAIKWNQQGPQGVTGPQGPQGSQGPKGDAGAPGTGATVGSIASGDPNCATGGASVTDGNGHTAYACNGATGAQGPKGDQGDPGAPGAPGTGAAVASLASGDPNCATGGASVTDGNGNTAYACNGAAGPQGPAGARGPAGPSGGAGSLANLDALNGLDCSDPDLGHGTVDVSYGAAGAISLTCAGPYFFNLTANLRAGSSSNTAAGGFVTSSPAGLRCGVSADPPFKDGFNSCTTGFAPGTQVTLTAVNIDGTPGGVWGGACSGPGTTPCTVTMSSDVTVIAAFSTP